MLHILLLILKIAGILLLTVLGIIVLILLSVLLVPVRYRSQGSFYGKPEGMLRITWFLHLVSVRISYQEELRILIRILGFPLFKEKKGEEDTFTVGESPSGGEEIFTGDSFTGELEEELVLSAQEQKENREPFAKIPAEGTGNDKSAPGSKAGIFRRLSETVKAFFHRLLLLFKKLCDAVKKAENWREKAAAFIGDEENKKTYHLIVKQLKKILRHVRPIRLKGNITFGFDEPYTTGQVLSGAALLYPFYRDKLSIRPVFDRQVLEGEIALKGRIRLGTLLTAGIRILLNKNFRKQLKRFLNQGGI